MDIKYKFPDIDISSDIYFTVDGSKFFLISDTFVTFDSKSGRQLCDFKVRNYLDLISSSSDGKIVVNNSAKYFEVYNLSDCTYSKIDNRGRVFINSSRENIIAFNRIEESYRIFDYNGRELKDFNNHYTGNINEDVRDMIFSYSGKYAIKKYEDRIEILWSENFKNMADIYKNMLSTSIITNNFDEIIVFNHHDREINVYGNV